MDHASLLPEWRTLIYRSGALLFTEMVHSYLPKWCITNYRFWCIVIYRLHLVNFQQPGNQYHPHFSLNDKGHLILEQFENSYLKYSDNKKLMDEKKINDAQINLDTQKEIQRLTLESLKFQNENKELKSQLDIALLLLAKEQKNDIPINATDRKTTIFWIIVTAICSIASALLGFLSAKL